MSETTPIIRPATQVRAATKHTKEFEAACVRVMADIENASAKGKYHTLFNPRPYHLRNESRPLSSGRDMYFALLI